MKTESYFVLHKQSKHIVIEKTDAENISKTFFESVKKFKEF